MRRATTRSAPGSGCRSAASGRPAPAASRNWNGCWPSWAWTGTSEGSTRPMYQPPPKRLGSNGKDNRDERREEPRAMGRHPVAYDQLIGYAAGELDASATAAVAAHLAGCPGCAATVARFRV